MEVRIIKVESGREYAVSVLAPGELQYMDREYRFNYVPQELIGCKHIMTCGNDKLTPENDLCFTAELDTPADIYILYPDKQPVIPGWLKKYERVRMNVTRQDSRSDNLKGYFSLYKKHFPAGEVRFYGNSPLEMLAQPWYETTGGINYCMYSVAVKAAE